MQNAIIFLGTFVACALLLLLAIRISSRKFTAKPTQANLLPSGKGLPEDAELLRLSKEQLDGFVKDDLKWLEDYALKKKDEATAKIQAALWDDLLRRIDLALNGF